MLVLNQFRPLHSVPREDIALNKYWTAAVRGSITSRFVCPSTFVYRRELLTKGSALRSSPVLFFII